MTKDGATWMTVCADPFHDYQMRVEGLPDLEPRMSIVQTHNFSASITKPLNAPANFDARILFTGYSGRGSDSTELAAPSLTFTGSGANVGLVSESQVANVVHFTDGGVGTPWPQQDNPEMGDIIVECVPSGTVCSYPEHFADRMAGTGLTSWHAYNTRFNGSAGRLIAIGIEVVNTTAEVYKQGTVFVCQPNSHLWRGIRSATMGAGATDTLKGFTDQRYSVVNGVPTFPSQHAQTPGSQTWEAAKGVYAIPRLCELNIQPTHGEVGESWGMREGDPIIGAIADYSKEVVVTYPYGDTVATTNVRFKYDHGHSWSGFTPISMYFAGLSNQTTLELRVRAIVEYFPTPSETLISLASPSPIYDPVAFQAYALIARNAPYAVPVGFNMDSRYFKMVLQVLSNAGLAAPLLAAVPTAGPILALGARGVATLSQMGLAALEGPKIQKDQAGAAAMSNVTYGDMATRAFPRSRKQKKKAKKRVVIRRN
jgi:hypothetical protein